MTRAVPRETRRARVAPQRPRLSGRHQLHLGLPGVGLSGGYRPSPESLAPKRTNTMDAWFKTPSEDQIAPTHAGAMPLPLLVVTTVTGLDGTLRFWRGEAPRGED